MSDSRQQPASAASEYRGFTIEHDPCSEGDWLYSLTDPPPGDAESFRADSIDICRAEIDDWWSDLAWPILGRARRKLGMASLQEESA